MKFSLVSNSKASQMPRKSMCFFNNSMKNLIMNTTAVAIPAPPPESVNICKASPLALILIISIVILSPDWSLSVFVFHTFAMVIGTPAPME